MDRLLYFPYITIPKTPWLYKSLLYWDSVDTITPSEYLNKNEDLFDESHMKFLIDAKLVNGITPAQYAYSIPNFTNDFLRYVDDIYVPDNYGNKSSLEKLKQGPKIHMEKMDSIGYELAKRGLAREDGMWFHMHPSVANDFMFYLATLIGNEINSQPITDTVESFNLSAPFGSQIQKNMLGREQLRKDILENAFPVPLDVENAKDMYVFKNKYEEQLKNFRKYIEKSLLEIDGAHPRFKDELKKELILYINDEKNSITSNMKVNWKQIIGASFLSIASDGLGIVDGVSSNNGIAIASSVCSILDLVREKFSEVRSTRQEALDNPIAYAFLVEKEFSK